LRIFKKKKNPELSKPDAEEMLANHWIGLLLLFFTTLKPRVE
jgi:hypothetical protein